MKYQQALEQRGLTKDQYSVRIQKEIDRIEHLVNKLQKNLSNDQREKTERKISDTDEKLSKQILKFDLNVYQSKLDSISKINNREDDEVEGSENNENEDVQINDDEEDVLTENEDSGEVQLLPEVKQQRERKFKTLTPDEVIKRNLDNFNQNIEELKKNIEINKEKFEEDLELEEQAKQPEQTVVEVEAEEEAVVVEVVELVVVVVVVVVVPVTLVFFFDFSLFSFVCLTCSLKATVSN